ncbi:hypothetical protein RI367_006325 [Sorochytrium milnesiophthora]
MPVGTADKQQQHATSRWDNMHQKRMQQTQAMESADYEEVDGPLLRQYTENVRTKDKFRSIRQLVSRMVLCLVIGTCAALLYLALHYGTELVSDQRFQLLRKYLGSSATTNARGAGAAYGISVAIGLGLTFIGVVITLAAGSGMPEAIAYLNGVVQPRYLTIQTFVCKLAGVLLIVNAGLFSGFDGPYIHCTATPDLGSLRQYPVCTIMTAIVVRNWKAVPILGAWAYGEKQHKARCAPFVRLHKADNAPQGRPDVASSLSIIRAHMLQQFVTVSAASGMASALQAPLAGTLFAVEEAMSFYEPSIIIRALFAAIVSWFVTAAIKQGKNFDPDQLSVFADNVLLLVLVTSAVVVFVPLIPAFKECTSLNRTLRFLERDQAPRCSHTCGDWLADSNQEASQLFGQCQDYVDNNICLDARQVQQKYIDVPANCSAGVPNSTIVSIFPNDLVTVAGVWSQMVATYGISDALISSVLIDVDPNSAFVATHTDPTDGSESASTTFRRLKKRSEGGSESSSEAGGEAGAEEGENILAGAKDYLQQHPEDACYYQMKSLLFNTPESALKNLFIRGYYDMFSAGSLLTFGFIYLLLSLATHHISLPTDLVIPTLVVGASFGRAYGLMMNEFKVQLGMTLVDPGAYAVLGMAAFWAGTSRMVLTVVLVAVEATGDQTDFFGFVVVVLVATSVGNLLGESQYHMEIAESGIPFLPFTASDKMRSMTVSDIMDRDPVVLDRQYSIDDVQSAIGVVKGEPGKSAPPDVHSGFPIVSDLQSRRVEGLILRSQVEEALAHAAEGHTWADYANYSPHIVHEHCSAAKAYRMFRSLGLRHLVVVDHNNRVVGMLTRRDFAHAVHDHGHAHGHEGEEHSGKHDPDAKGHGHGATHKDHDLSKDNAQASHKPDSIRATSELSPE